MTYRPGSNLPVEAVEAVEADHHGTEAGGTTLMFRTVRSVAFEESEVVVRRPDGGTVLTGGPA